MSKLSSEVASLEAENESMKRAVPGNVLLRRRDGFERSMSLHGCGRYGEDGLPYVIEQGEYRPPHYGFSDALADARVSYTTVHYRRRNEKDFFGRTVYLEA